MSTVSVIVEYDVKKAHLDEFLALIRGHAARTKANEPGCLQFDVLKPQDSGLATKVFLYEKYVDQAAFQAHLDGPQIAKLRASNYRAMQDGSRPVMLDPAEGA